MMTRYIGTCVLTILAKYENKTLIEENISQTFEAKL